MSTAAPTEETLLNLGLRVARTLGETRDRCITDIVALDLPPKVFHLITHLDVPVIRPNRQQDVDLYTAWRTDTCAEIAVLLDEAGW